jgi:protein-S-isoprenylcysteine O-methyltransferase Ste14
MKNVIKQLFSFILPVTILILIPLWIESDISVKNLLTFIPGLILICTGLFLLVMTISKFIRIGKGTLAPWSPTKRLVSSGLYGYVRNPMITGVLTALIGESIAILSWNIFIEAVIFFIFNNLFFFFYEEPGLEARFGDEYLRYKKNVPRWIPRSKPYDPDSGTIQK